MEAVHLDSEMTQIGPQLLIVVRAQMVGATLA